MILPKIGKVAMVEELRFAGSIREVTVNRTAGTWFACFCIEDGQAVPPLKNGPTIGVDVGVGAMAVCSDGTHVENPRALTRGLNRLRRVDKAIARSRKVHGRSSHSNRRERLHARRRRIHAQVVNVRSDHHHKATAAIAKSAGRVVVEALNGIRHDAQPEVVQGDRRRGDVGIPLQAGVQVSLVRSGVREDGPLVRVVEALLPLWLEER